MQIIHVIKFFSSSFLKVGFIFLIVFFNFIEHINLLIKFLVFLPYLLVYLMVQ
uniref:Uncharacterized protein n=1 Tax=uncultured marine virus TaxID=186617 RepID=A0A0F7L5L3_9VIRU|nr:hypothetical protein [uncultured marine virus]